MKRKTRQKLNEARSKSGMRTNFQYESPDVTSNTDSASDSDTEQVRSLTRRMKWKLDRARREGRDNVSSATSDDEDFKYAAVCLHYFRSCSTLSFLNHL